MNKTITIYELLGLVKDGKAPKKIRVTGNIYEYDEEFKFYLTQTKDGKVCLGGLLNEINLLVNCFNENNVEIIEDNDKLEKIKWNEKESRAGILRTDQEIEVLARRTETLKKKIAELIDHINKIEERLDER